MRPVKIGFLVGSLSGSLLMFGSMKKCNNLVVRLVSAGRRRESIVKYVGLYGRRRESVVKYVGLYGRRRESVVKYMGLYGRRRESVVKYMGLYGRRRESVVKYAVLPESGAILRKRDPASRPTGPVLPKSGAMF